MVRKTIEMYVLYKLFCFYINIKLFSLFGNNILSAGTWLRTKMGRI